MTSHPGRPRVRKFEDIKKFDATTDVIVCGFGGAGACAALEARAAGAEVMVLERASGFGGSTALSAGEMYLGGSGGTPLQKRHGFEDTTENFLAYLQTSYGETGDAARMKIFAERGAEHFNWLAAQGVVFNDEFWPEREVVNLEGRSLQYTGNERAYPFSVAAKPVPRGHLPAGAGHAGGQVLMTVLGRRVESSGADVRYDCRTTALIQDESGRIRGVAAKVEGREYLFYARQAVVMCLGGFIMNEEMTRKHIPTFDVIAQRHGNPYDLGDGILMGLEAGGHAINMGEAFADLAYYPPSQLTFGILLNNQAQRFINEDCYLARLFHFAFMQRDDQVYLFVDQKHYARSEFFPKAELVAVGETVEEVEREAKLPPGALVQTVTYYNAHAARGEDPLFGKATEWLQPLDTPPFALVSYRLSMISPRVFTLGGLQVLPTGEVLTVDKQKIPGLYAAGRTVAGIPRNNKGYNSGTSVADATLFGRIAGRQAATQELKMPS